MSHHIVVPKGTADKIFINTSGVGRTPAEWAEPQPELLWGPGNDSRKPMTDDAMHVAFYTIVVFFSIICVIHFTVFVFGFRAVIL